MMIHGGTLAALPAAALFVVAACGYILAEGGPNRRLIWFTKPFAMPFLGLAYVLGYLLTEGLRHTLLIDPQGYRGCCRRG